MINEGVWHNSSKAIIRGLELCLDCIEKEKMFTDKDGNYRIADCFINGENPTVLEFQKKLVYKDLKERTNFHALLNLLDWIFNVNNKKFEALDNGYFRIKASKLGKNIPKLFKYVRSGEFCKIHKRVELILDDDKNYYKIIDIDANNFVILEKFDSKFKFIINLIGRKYFADQRELDTLEFLENIFANNLSVLPINKNVTVKGIHIDNEDYPILKGIVLQNDADAFSKEQIDIIFKYKGMFNRLFKPTLPNGSINHRFLKNFVLSNKKAKVGKVHDHTGRHVNIGLYQMYCKSNKKYGSLLFSLKKINDNKSTTAWWIGRNKKKKSFNINKNIVFEDSRVQNIYLNTDFSALYLEDSED